MSQFTRRDFVKAGSLALAGAVIPHHLVEGVVAGDEQHLHSMLNAGLDAASSGGAIYADAHFRVMREERWVPFAGTRYPAPRSRATAGLGIRALVNGYWGYAAMSGIVTREGATRLAQDATAQAKVAASLGKPRTVDLAPLPSIAKGSWITPLAVDPFTVSYEEKADFFTGMSDAIQRYKYGIGVGPEQLTFVKEERVFASTDGAFTNQTVYQTSGTLSVNVPAYWKTDESGTGVSTFMSLAGAGWEYIRNAPFQDNIDQLIKYALDWRDRKPVDVGRYDIVFDAHALAGIISSSLGAATELDRAFGYEANDVGTSYISDPLKMLGIFKIGSPLLNITANRSMPGGAATVKWDDEGAEPVETLLIKEGIVNDMQTTRESASWLASYYQKRGVPVRSNGCAGVYTPTSPVTQTNPNFVLQPGKHDISFEDLIKDTKKGLAVIGGSTESDHQALNGSGTGSIMYEIVNGKLGQAIKHAQYLYRAPDFWKNLLAIGGRSSARNYGFRRNRYGNPAAHTVASVPGKVTGVAVTDFMRKA